MMTSSFLDDTWRQPLVLLLSSLAAGGLLHTFLLKMASRKMEKWTDVTGATILLMTTLFETI